MTVDKSRCGVTEIGATFRYFAVSSSAPSKSSIPGEDDLARLFKAASASVLDLRGARFDSSRLASGESVDEELLLESLLIATAPCTGISRQETSKFPGLPRWLPCRVPDSD